MNSFRRQFRGKIKQLQQLQPAEVIVDSSNSQDAQPSTHQTEVCAGQKDSKHQCRGYGRSSGIANFIKLSQACSPDESFNRIWTKNSNKFTQSGLPRQDITSKEACRRNLQEGSRQAPHQRRIPIPALDAGFNEEPRQQTSFSEHPPSYKRRAKNDPKRSPRATTVADHPGQRSQIPFSHCLKRHTRTCSQFMALSLVERYEEVCTKRLCFHCLTRGHKLKDCCYKPDLLCGVEGCRSRHHHLVHRPQQATFLPTMEDFAASFYRTPDFQRDPELRSSDLEDSGTMQTSSPSETTNARPGNQIVLIILLVFALMICKRFLPSTLL